MVLKPEPIFECVEAIRGQRSLPLGGRKSKGGKESASKRSKPGWVVLLGPQGEPLRQELAAVLARKKHLILIAGHYEGIDQRVRDYLVDQEISVGDFITMGGEAPALCLIEAVVRFVPGVIGNRDSLRHESFQGMGLEYPQYTRPREYRGMKVPEVLVSGDHEAVTRWREKMAYQVTREKRPDLARSLS